MGLKGYLIVDPECGQICDDAVEAMKEYIGADEIEVMEAAEAMRRGMDLGDPDGVPFVCVRSETTQKCLTNMYFHNEDGKVVLQPYPTVFKGDEEPVEESQESVETE